MADQERLICARCQAILTPGTGTLWEVRIDAVADPWPPNFTQEDLQSDRPQKEWRELVERMKDLSPREAMEQVQRQMVIHLCNRCFAQWYEHPAG
ncbi:MAG: hypothetical protein ACQESR_21370 [Planctomycetota bacterium]